MMQENPHIKKISFDDYVKYFHDLLSSQEIQQQRIIFYRRDAETIRISFSYDIFLILTEVRISKLIEEYEQEMQDYGEPIEVAMDETGDHPAVVQFMAKYLSRGIPEVD